MSTYVWIDRAQLTDERACEEGLALFDAVKAAQDDMRRSCGKAPRKKLRLEWSPIAYLWLECNGRGFASWLYGRGIVTMPSFEGANLASANLAYVNIERANLTGANLASADLAGADLARANLDGANLTGANLEGAYLAGANLYSACLAGANLDGAYLTDANLDGANIERANLTGANLTGTRGVMP